MNQMRLTALTGLLLGCTTLYCFYAGRAEATHLNRGAVTFNKDVARLTSPGQTPEVCPCHGIN